MAMQRLTPADMAPPGGAYVHGVVAGGLVFVAGQVARTSEGHTVGVDDIEAQAAQALDNVRSVLAAAGCTLADVAKMTVYLTDIRHIQRVGAVRRRYFGDHVPASATVEVSKLAEPELMIEIDAVAVVPSPAPAIGDDEL
jgi:reactive intermediate/imine deaminase